MTTLQDRIGTAFDNPRDSFLVPRIHPTFDIPHPEGSDDDRLVLHCKDTHVHPEFKYKLVWREHGGYRPISGDGTLIAQLHDLAKSAYESIVSEKDFSFGTISDNFHRGERVHRGHYFVKPSDENLRRYGIVLFVDSETKEE